MPITYNIFRSDGTLDFQLEEGTVQSSHGLTFTGFQKPAYGEHRANNLIRLLENFATEEDAAALQLIVSQNETDYNDTGANGSFTSGTGYAGADTITLDNGAIVTVDSVNVSGGVSTFTVTSVGYLVRTTDLIQTDTSGVGEGFSLTPDTNNVVAASGFPPETAIDFPLIGQFWYNKTANLLKVWTGSLWANVSTDTSTLPGPVDVDNGAVSIATARVLLPTTTGGNIIITNITSHDDFDDHVTDPTDAHDATAIFFNDTGDIPGDNVQLAIFDVQGNLDAHISDPTDAHDASAISSTATGSISSTNAQAAFQELEDEVNVEQTQITNVTNNLAAHIADAVDAHDASAISYDNSISGLPAAFDVQVAIIELNDAVGGTSNQSVIDSLRVVRVGVQNFAVNTWTKVGFNSVQFGDDLGQWDSVLNRYTASFDQVVRVTCAVSINTINDENFMLVSIWKNGAQERTVEEWKWTEESDPPGDRECSAVIDLDSGEYIEGYVWRNAGGGTISIDTLTTRTALEIDVIKAQETPPPPSPVTLNDHTITDADITPGVASTSFTMQSNGDVSSSPAPAPAFTVSEWHNTNPNAGIGALFQVRATLTGGVAPDSGVLNTWQTMNVNRTWTQVQPSVGSATTELFMEIRDVATMTLQDTGFITLSASVAGGGK